jgi:hypothetical protein
MKKVEFKAHTAYTSHTGLSLESQAAIDAQKRLPELRRKWRMRSGRGKN